MQRRELLKLFGLGTAGLLLDELELPKKMWFVGSGAPLAVETVKSMDSGLWVPVPAPFGGMVFSTSVYHSLKATLDQIAYAS